MRYYNKYLGAYSPDLEKFAKNDGFASFADMIDFFQTAYPPKKNREWSFDGKLITFENVRVEAERYSKKQNEII